MTRNSNPIAVSPWTGRLHLALTLLLVVAAAGIAGLASAGKVQFGQKPVAATDDSKSKIEGRYQIEKVEDVHEILERAGRSYFGTQRYDVWVFKYKGGLIEATLETDIDGETVKVATVPDDWRETLPLPKTLTKESEVPVNFNGYIIISAIRTDVTEFELIEPYLTHLGGILAFGSQGPLEVVPSLFLEVKQFRPYHIFVSASPPPDENGQGFNIRGRDRPILISTPLLIKNPAIEEAFVGGGKDLKPGKQEILLDRQRGYSRIRLKARFLGDGEVRDLLPK